jgi:hypothetical protein
MIMELFLIMAILPMITGLINTFIPGGSSTGGGVTNIYQAPQFSNDPAVLEQQITLSEQELYRESLKYEQEKEATAREQATMAAYIGSGAAFGGAVGAGVGLAWGGIGTAPGALIGAGLGGLGGMVMYFVDSVAAA